MTSEKDHHLYQLGFVLGTFMGLFISIIHIYRHKDLNNNQIKTHLRTHTEKIPKAIDDLVELLLTRN